MAHVFLLRVWAGHLLQTSLPHCEPTMLVAIEPLISYTARLQDKCNPALSQTRKLVTPNVFWAYIAIND
jgi:hypothetical protein